MLLVRFLCREILSEKYLLLKKYMDEEYDYDLGEKGPLCQL